jgi:hypothetical protein
VKWGQGKANTVLAKAAAMALGKKKFPLTALVKKVVENRSQETKTDTLEYIDPKISAMRTGDAAASEIRIQQPFSDAYVFVVGGGNYAGIRSMYFQIKAYFDDKLMPTIIRTPKSARICGRRRQKNRFRLF